jgi:anti-sigma regulatory factor (Ser/Thr protein kinase)
MSAIEKPTRFRVRKEIPSRLEEVDAVCLELRALLQEQGLASSGFALELVARECLNNAVLHGNGGDSGKIVVLNLLCREGRLRLQVSDEGEGIARRDPGPTLPANIDAVNGRGMFIVQTYAERVRFNPRGNQITLWLRQQAQEKKECYD